LAQGTKSGLHAAFFQRNMDRDVVEKRKVRKALRALSGQTVHFEFERDESRTVEDGVEEYTDSEGKRQTRTRYSTITGTLYCFSHILPLQCSGDACSAYVLSPRNRKRGCQTLGRGEFVYRYLKTEKYRYICRWPLGSRSP
jgi:hypothetical protein